MRAQGAAASAPGHSAAGAQAGPAPCRAATSACAGKCGAADLQQHERLMPIGYARALKERQCSIVAACDKQGKHAGKSQLCCAKVEWSAVQHKQHCIMQIRILKRTPRLQWLAHPLPPQLAARKHALAPTWAGHRWAPKRHWRWGQ